MYLCMYFIVQYLLCIKITVNCLLSTRFYSSMKLQAKYFQIQSDVILGQSYRLKLQSKRVRSGMRTVRFKNQWQSLFRRNPALTFFLNSVVPGENNSTCEARVKVILQPPGSVQMKSYRCTLRWRAGCRIGDEGLLTIQTQTLCRELLWKLHVHLSLMQHSC